MIKMYANDKPDDWHGGCGVVPDKDENFCYECYLLTDSELEQLKGEYWDAAREVGVYDVHGHDMQVYIHSSLEDYELSKSSKKDGEG